MNPNDLQYALEVFIPSLTFPIIITFQNEIYAMRNVELNSNPGEEEFDREIRQIVDKMDSYFNPLPVIFQEDTLGAIHYGDPQLIANILWLPYIEIGLISFFIGLLLISFHYVRRHEQDRIWVGMTRETAHQLGTPISSLFGWLGLLEEEAIDKKLIHSMNQDVNRLKQISDRFYKVGTKPRFTDIEMLNLAHEIVDYMKTRVPKNMKMKFNVSGDHVSIKGAKTLLGWAIENLLKNAVDACKGNDGQILIQIGEMNEFVYLDVKDNGLGIPKKDWKSIFEPGFSKKQKGWGLGLSLTRRIIEQIHNGEIRVMESQQGGTRIRISLPHDSINKSSS